MKGTRRENTDFFEIMLLPYDYNFINRQKMINLASGKVVKYKGYNFCNQLTTNKQTKPQKAKKHPSISVRKKRCNKKNEKRAVLDF